MLDYYGIRGTSNQWIASLLTGRMQSVVVEGQISHTIPVTSGVPQGSVLRPLLFLLYINDLPECVSSQSTVRLFADDSFLYRKIRSAADSIQLQHDLDQLAVWEQSWWLMSFNTSKCNTWTSATALVAKVCYVSAIWGKRDQNCPYPTTVYSSSHHITWRKRKQASKASVSEK